MKSLIYGGAAAALLVGLAFQVHAEIAVREAPEHAVPLDEDEASATELPAPKADVPKTTVKIVQAPAPEKVDAPAAKDEPAPVRVLTEAKAPPAADLTPQESAFFTALGQRVTDAASAYENYVRRAGGIDPAFNGATAVNRAVKLGAAYHPRQLEEGIVAYAALIALRNQAFVDGVRAIQNPAFADGLSADPARIMQVRGADAAAADAAGVLKAQGEALMAAGKAVTKAAYDIQGQAWSKSPVADPQGVLDGAKTSAGQMRFATTPSKAKLLDSLVAAPQNLAAQTADAAAAPAPDVVRGLALAALAILGRTGDGMEAQYEALLHDASAADCLKMAKLNLNQCLAVAGPNYEDAYCAGRHAVSDTGKCIANAAGGGPGLETVPAPKLQEADAIGPEQAAAYGKPAPSGVARDDDDIAAAPLAPAVAAATPLTAPPGPPATPAPAPRQYAQAPAPAYAQPQLQPPPQPYSAAQNDYAPPQAYQQQPAYPPQGYQQPQYQAQPQPQQPQPYQQQPYAQPQYAPQPYPQAYAQQGYAPQPYAQPRSSYAPSYGQQPYYPQQQGYPAYQGGYYGR